MYKNYFFDLYGTILDIDTNEDLENIWEKLSLYYSYYGACYDAYELRTKYQKIITKIINSNPKTDFPEIDIQDVFYKLFMDKDVKPKKRMSKDTARVFRMLTTNNVEIFDGVIELLQKLKEKKAMLYILANAQNVYAIPEMRRVGIKKLFEGFFFSSDFGKCMPDTEFINAAIIGDSIKKKETIIISTNADSLRAAASLGIDTLYINIDMDNEISGKDFKYEVKGRNYKEVLKILLNK